MRHTRPWAVAALVLTGLLSTPARSDGPPSSVPKIEVSASATGPQISAKGSPKPASPGSPTSASPSPVTTKPAGPTSTVTPTSSASVEQTESTTSAEGPPTGPMPLIEQPLNGAGEIVVAQIHGVINPMTAEYIDRVFAEATRREARLVILEIHTPGGLMSSMWSIVNTIVNSKVPVVGHVTPPSANAASAGTFILLACHVAAMAPSTTIGAAHPVGVSGDDKDDSTMMKKVVNDSVTRMRQNTARHGRNPAWAEKAIRLAATVGTDEALKIKAIDLKAESRARLIEQLEGRDVVMMTNQRIRLHLKAATVVELEPTMREKFLHTISSPDVCYLLFMLGVACIGIEAYSGGAALFPGIVGALAFVMAMMGFNVLPVNYVGVLLILLSFVFFLAEAKVGAGGIIAVLGLGSLVLGSMMLFDGSLPALRVSNQAVLSVSGTVGSIFLFIIFKMVKDMNHTVTSGLDAMVGLTGTAVESVTGSGMVKVQGELWRAFTRDTEAIEQGATIRVVAGVDGRLEVTAK